MSSENHDLSPYEVARLERIKRNEDRLRSLGLIGNNAVKPKAKPRKKTSDVSRKRRKETRVPTRSSKRLKQLKEGRTVEDEDVKRGIDSSDEENVSESKPEEKVNYDTLPQEPDNLDDDEFQVYVSLRAWRLRRKNELEVEPYKICQNRTLCVLIRKRRHEANFASSQLGDEVVEQDLLSIWGIGPSKAATGGFGWEMLDVLNSEENTKLLELSRKHTPQKDD